MKFSETVKFTKFSETVVYGSFVVFSDDPGLSVSCSVPKILVFKVAKPLKIGSFGAPVFMERDTPNFGHASSNLAHFQTCGRFWLSSIQ